VSDQLSDWLAAPRSRVHVHGPSSNSARDLDRAPDLLREEAVVSRTDSNPRGPSAMRSCRVVQRKCRNLLDVVEVFEGQGKRRLGGEVACGCVVGQSCLIGVSSTSMTLRQILPGWDALSVHHPAEASPAPGPRSPGRHERDGATQLPVRCSTASGVASCAADEPITTRLELSPRPWQGPRHGPMPTTPNGARDAPYADEASEAQGGTWHASSSPVPPTG
jgi:hypothetical protein